MLYLYISNYSLLFSPDASDLSSRLYYCQSLDDMDQYRIEWEFGCIFHCSEHMEILRTL